MKQGSHKIMFIACVGAYSGAENMSLTIADKLVDRGYDAIYCSPRGIIDNYMPRHFPRVKRKALSQFNFIEVIRAIRSENPDIVHCVDYRVSMLLSLTHYPYVAHLHNNSTWIRKKSIFTLFLLHTLNKSNGNILVSDSIYKEFVYHEHIHNRTETLLNIVDKEKVVKNAQENIGEEFEIGYFGRITPQKNPMRFLSIIDKLSKKMPGLRAVVVGKSDGTYDSEWNAYISEHKLNIKAVGFQENPYKYMKACKIVLMPSLWEGFGLTAVEAMILGVPVLSTDVGGLIDVQQGTGNICNTDDEFIERAVFLLSNPKAYEENSRIVQKLSDRFTDIDTYIEKVIAIYNGK